MSLSAICIVMILLFITACKWISDLICDDRTNTEECQFDGGDCCLGEQTITATCKICLCHDTGLYNTVAPGGIFKNGLFVSVFVADVTLIWGCWEILVESVS
jgi:hypothetical protein